MQVETGWKVCSSTPLLDQADIETDSAVASIIGIGVIAGQVVGGVLATKIGHIRYQLMVAFTCAGIFLGCECLTFECEPRSRLTEAVRRRCGCDTVQ